MHAHSTAASVHSDDDGTQVAGLCLPNVKHISSTGYANSATVIKSCKLKGLLKQMRVLGYASILCTMHASASKQNSNDKQDT